MSGAILAGGTPGGHLERWMTRGVRFDAVPSDLLREARPRPSRRAEMDLVDALLDVASQASEAGWDGYDARPADPDSLRHTYTLVRRLPQDLPAPEFSVDPDGEISLEWFVGPRRTFSVSVGADGRLSYAGLHDEATVHGTDRIGDDLPELLLFHLRRLGRA